MEFTRLRALRSRTPFSCVLRQCTLCHVIWRLIGCRKAYLNKIQQFFFLVWAALILVAQRVLFFRWWIVCRLCFVFATTILEPHTRPRRKHFSKHLSNWHLAKKTESPLSSALLCTFYTYPFNSTDFLRVRKWLLSFGFSNGHSMASRRLKWIRLHSA